MTHPCLVPQQSSHLSHPGAAETIEPAAPWRVVVSGAGAAQMLMVDALLSQHDVPVQVSLVGRIETGLRRVGSRPARRACQVGDGLGRILADPRVEVSPAGLPATPGSADVDVVLHAPSLQPGAATERNETHGRLGGVVTARELREHLRGRAGQSSATELPRQLSAARSAVVVGSATAAVALVRAATDCGGQSASAPQLREIHLMLNRATLHSPATAEALEALLTLDAEVAVDTSTVEPAAHGGRRRPDCRLQQSVETLTTLSERFASPDAVYLHIDFDGQPVQVIGRDNVEAVVIAPPPAGATNRELSTVPADLLIRCTARAGALAMVPHDGCDSLVREAGGRVIRDGAVAEGEYIAVETGSQARDALAARRATDAFIEDALRGRLTHSSFRCEAGGADSDRHDGPLSVVIPFTLPQSRQARALVDAVS
jgi:ferredoxin--NADP+ reductase